MGAWLMVGVVLLVSAPSPRVAACQEVDRLLERCPSCVGAIDAARLRCWQGLLDGPVGGEPSLSIEPGPGVGAIPGKGGE
jgi:hypothetical protein